MPLVILYRRTITYREAGTGEITVLLVPGRDQIQVVKDLAGLGSSPTQVREAGAKANSAVKKLIQLSRVHIGRRFIYGNLPTEISDLRQPVKVWLAEDYAPLQSQAFFYIFSNSVVVHGVREQDDEGYQTWRTAQLALDEVDPLKGIINAISDYALANSVDTLTVAVLNKLDLYEKLQAGLATYNISPMPFSKLKPQSHLKALYRHRDYTILYLTLALFGLITLLASGSYATLAYLQRKKMDDQVADIQHRIDNIKLNQNVGQIADPQSVLQTMGHAVNQQPSAILDAAGSLAAEFGKLSSVKALIGGGSQDGTVAAPPAGQLNVLATIEKMKDELLLTQEQEASQILATHPWVREIRRGGAVGDNGQLVITLQIDQAPGATAPEANVSGTLNVSPTTAGRVLSVSGSLVSGTTVSTLVPVSLSTVSASAPISVSSMAVSAVTIPLVKPAVLPVGIQGGKK